MAVGIDVDGVNLRQAGSREVTEEEALLVIEKLQILGRQTIHFAGEVCRESNHIIQFGKCRVEICQVLRHYLRMLHVDCQRDGVGVVMDIGNKRFVLFDRRERGVNA